MMSVAFVFNILLILLLLAFIAAFFYYRVKKSGADQMVEDSLTRGKIILRNNLMKLQE